MRGRRLTTVIAVIALMGIAFFAFKYVRGPMKVQVLIEPYQNPQRFTLLGHDVVGREEMPSPPLGMLQTSMYRASGEKFLVVYFKAPGFDSGKPEERMRLRGEVKAWLELRNEGLSAVEVYPLEGYEAAYVVVPDFDLDESEKVLLHIEGQGAHAAYTISGFGTELPRKERHGIGFSEINGPGDQHFKIECRALRWIDKLKPSSVLTSFEVKLTTKKCEFIPFITALNVYSDVFVDGKNLNFGGGMFGPALVHSQKSIGIGHTGLTTARSRQLYADIEYMLLYPNKSEESVLTKSGDEFRVRTASYELRIRNRASSAKSFECIPRIDASSNDYRYVIVEGIGPTPFYLMLDEDMATGVLWNVDWSLNNYVGKEVRLSLAEASKPRKERYIAYVQDATTQRTGFWNVKEPGTVRGFYRDSW